CQPDKDSSTARLNENETEHLSGLGFVVLFSLYLSIVLLDKTLSLGYSGTPTKAIDFTVDTMVALVRALVDYKVDCSEQQIRIRVNLKGHNFTDVYFENLKGYPGCAPNFTRDHQAAVFDIPIRDDFRCGVGKMTNKITGLKTYFHRIVLEEDEDSRNNSDAGVMPMAIGRSRQAIFFKCQLADRRRLLLNRTKRAASSQFPFELVEPE
ncbi:hypothetical protein BIW11_13742, partial [Tropilaelaps mercedesae]